MSHTELTYLINCGIAPYFQEIIVDEINCCCFYTMSFNENLNKVMQTFQMDLVVRFWHTIKIKFLGIIRTPHFWSIQKQMIC